MKHSCLRLLLTVLGIAVIAGCKSTPVRLFDPRADATTAVVTNLSAVTITNSIPREWLEPSAEPFRIGPGDKLEIEVFGDAASRTIVTVGPDGKIYYYLLPGLDVWGMTLTEAKAALERELTRFISAPQVGVALRGIESRRVWLLGRLQNAGVYPMAAPMTLLESIALAGGTSNTPGTSEDIADLSRSFIVRDGRLLPVDFQQLLRNGNMAQNIYLQPDDFIYLPSALSRQVNVLGGVRVPQVVPYSEQLTVVSAVAASGGTIKDAYLSHVAIVRGSLTEPKIAIVDYGAMVKGTTPDVRLEQGDILYVPFTPYRNLVKYANLIVETFVRAVAINEGARAASRAVVPVGVNITSGSISAGGVSTGTRR